MENLTGKVAVITGAASGIGRALALQLAKEGCGLAIADMDGEGLEETRQLTSQYPAAVVPYVLDVSDRGKIFSLAEAVARRQGGADLLINNAGIGGQASFVEMDLDVMERFMKVNFWSVVYGCKAFLHQLLEKPEAHIVNVSSVEGILAFPYHTAYASSKFAIRGFTEVLRIDLRRTRVGVSCVFPGGIKTNIARNSVRFAKQYMEEHPELADMIAEKLKDSDLHVAAFDAIAQTSAEDAAAAIIAGVKKSQWRILIGPDAVGLDELARTHPEDYLDTLVQSWPKGLGPDW
jgi:NAD(P)-dependent dehydrogenase (short-subunit alcohol dehydrogenase family)